MDGLLKDQVEVVCGYVIVKRKLPTRLLLKFPKMSRSPATKNCAFLSDFITFAKHTISVAVKIGKFQQHLQLQSKSQSKTSSIVLNKKEKNTGKKKSKATQIKLAAQPFC